MTDRATLILVGVDGSESSIDALREAAALAEALGCQLQALTVWHYPSLAEPYPGVEWSPEDDAKRILEQSVAEAFADAPPAGLTTRVVQGSTAHALIGASSGARMLVLGSRGRGGFVGLLLGSVSATCAEHAECPVLIVHRQRDD